MTIRRELERRKLLRMPLVYVSPLIGPGETTRLREYVRRLQGSLAEASGEMMDGWPRNMCVCVRACAWKGMGNAAAVLLLTKPHVW